ncbi:MAG: threonine/serine exporter family protein, partial [Methanobacterium sp.]|nr:threonine/serine exporter family protein [Methanobacterium sp.]
TQNKPRLALITPVIGSFLVSILFFWAVKNGFLTGSMLLIIPALAYFLPGATLTTGMFELASGDLISGSSRVIYGITILFLLLFGVLNGFKIIGLPQEELLVVTAANTMGWWAPYIGIMLFGIGMFFFMSMRNRDFPWVMIVLYMAFLGQSLGNYFIGGFFGAFFGSLLMTISGTLIGRSPMRTPSFVSTLSAFWLLVPGSLGFISLANLIGPNYSSGIADVIQVIMSVVAISLGLLIGAVIAEPLKLQKIKLKKFKKYV